MNEKQRLYILSHWQDYDLVDSRGEMIKLLNVLEVHGETLDSLHNSTGEFCGIYMDYVDDRSVVKALFEHNLFFATRYELERYCSDNARCCDITLDEYIALEDIRYSSDGIIVVLHY